MPIIRRRKPTSTITVSMKFCLTNAVVFFRNCINDILLKVLMKTKRKLSIIIPVFNEENVVAESLKRVSQVNLGRWSKELIIVDDASRDNSRKIIQNLIKNPIYKKIKFISHKINKGKGGAIQTALKHVTGDAVIVQDADLEYNPNDIPKLLKKLEKGEAQIIFGSRQAHVNKKDEIMYVWGINLSTKLINLLYGSGLTDLYTCYKLYSKECLGAAQAKSNGFEWDIEFVAKLLKKGFKIQEVPISYHPRSFSEGKKIKIWDGLAGLWVIFKYRFFN